MKQESPRFSHGECQIELYTPNGAYKGHAGGISYVNDVVYIASGEVNYIYVLSFLKYYFGILTKGRYVHSYDFYYIEK